MRKRSLDLADCAVLELNVFWLALVEAHIGLDGELSWPFVGLDDLAIVEEGFIDLDSMMITSR